MVDEWEERRGERREEGDRRSRGYILNKAEQMDMEPDIGTVDMPQHAYLRPISNSNGKGSEVWMKVIRAIEVSLKRMLKS